MGKRPMEGGDKQNEGESQRAWRKIETHTADRKKWNGERERERERKGEQ